MKISYVLILSFFLLIVASCTPEHLKGSVSKSDCVDTNCRDYESTIQAQQDFDWNPDCRSDLDADNDGLACEENIWVDYYSAINRNNSNSGGSQCPSTSNCGCSGLNKSPCESNSCCRWVVGSSCKCK